MQRECLELHITAVHDGCLVPVVLGAAGPHPLTNSSTCRTDASIWMVQFMRAMRDERGDMMRNAHLIGFMRRICR